MPVYLRGLIDRFRRSGGRLVARHIDKLSDVADNTRAVINCSGIHAAQLAHDPTVYPIRGQLVVVSNPGITEFFSEDTGDSPDLTHYLPHGDTVVLGGIAVPHDERTEPDPAIAMLIVDRCAAIEPRLRGARILEHRVGLRPTRPEIRLDLNRLDGIDVIHNYGHGGAGVSLAWGCAAEIRQLLTDGPLRLG
jgi:D-amino-acid oxidase